MTRNEHIRGTTRVTQASKKIMPGRWLNGTGMVREWYGHVTGRQIQDKNYSAKKPNWNSIGIVIILGPFKCYVTQSGGGSAFPEKALRTCKFQRY